MNGRAQVSMNITDFRATPMARVHARFESLRATTAWTPSRARSSDLIPQDAYDPDAEWLREVPNFDPEAKVLERRPAASAGVARRVGQPAHPACY